MTPSEVADAAVAATRARFHQIRERSDVKYTQMRTTTYDLKKWKGKLPEDFRLFYGALGGLHFHWEFTDDPHHMHHGPRFLALHPDGRRAIEPESRLTEPGRMPAQKYEFLGDEVMSWGKDPVLVFSGRPGEGGLLLRQTGDDAFAYYGFDSDGNVTHIADTLTAFIDKALRSGFAANWDRNWPSADQAVEKLDTVVPPRKLVRGEVIARVPYTGEEHRRARASGVTKGTFDKLMRALGRPERAKALDDEARTAAVLDAFAGAAEWSAATCKVAAPIAGSYQKSTRKAILEALRLDAPDQVRVTFRITKMETRGVPVVGFPPGALEAILGDGLGFGPYSSAKDGPSTFAKGGVAEVVCTFADAERAEPLTVGWSHTVAQV